MNEKCMKICILTGILLIVVIIKLQYPNLISNIIENFEEVANSEPCLPKSGVTLEEGNFIKDPSANTGSCYQKKNGTTDSVSGVCSSDPNNKYTIKRMSKGKIYSKLRSEVTIKDKDTDGTEINRLLTNAEFNQFWKKFKNNKLRGINKLPLVLKSTDLPMDKTESDNLYPYCQYDLSTVSDANDLQFYYKPGSTENTLDITPKKIVDAGKIETPTPDSEEDKKIIEGTNFNFDKSFRLKNDNEVFYELEDANLPLSSFSLLGSSSKIVGGTVKSGNISPLRMNQEANYPLTLLYCFVPTITNNGKGFFRQTFRLGPNNSQVGEITVDDKKMYIQYGEWTNNAYLMTDIERDVKIDGKIVRNNGISDGMVCYLKVRFEPILNDRNIYRDDNDNVCSPSSSNSQCILDEVKREITGYEIKANLVTYMLKDDTVESSKNITFKYSYDPASGRSYCGKVKVSSFNLKPDDVYNFSYSTIYAKYINHIEIKQGDTTKYNQHFSNVCSKNFKTFEGFSNYTEQFTIFPQITVDTEVPYRGYKLGRWAIWAREEGDSKDGLYFLYDNSNDGQSENLKTRFVINVKEGLLIDGDDTCRFINPGGNGTKNKNLPIKSCKKHFKDGGFSFNNLRLKTITKGLKFGTKGDSTLDSWIMSANGNALHFKFGSQLILALGPNYWTIKPYQNTGTSNIYKNYNFSNSNIGIKQWWCNDDQYYKCAKTKSQVNFDVKKDTIDWDNDDLDDFEEGTLGNWFITETMNDSTNYRYNNNKVHNYLDFSYKGSNYLRLNGSGSIVSRYNPEDDGGNNIYSEGAHLNAFKPCTEFGDYSCDGKERNMTSKTQNGYTCQNWGCFVDKNGNRNWKGCMHTGGAMWRLWNDWFRKKDNGELEKNDGKNVLNLNYLKKEGILGPDGNPHNKCIDPSGTKRPWCYTTSRWKRWDYCNPQEVQEDGICPKSNPYVYRPNKGHDYCCQSGDGWADKDGLNSKIPTSTRSDHCKNSRYVKCKKPPCKDNPRVEN